MSSTSEVQTVKILYNRPQKKILPEIDKKSDLASDKKVTQIFKQSVQKSPPISTSKNDKSINHEPIKEFSEKEEIVGHSYEEVADSNEPSYESQRTEDALPPNCHMGPSEYGDGYYSYHTWGSDY